MCKIMNSCLKAQNNTRRNDDQKKKTNVAYTCTLHSSRMLGIFAPRFKPMPCNRECR